MKAIKIVLASFVILCFFSTNGYAFRCGNGLVTSGDKEIKVRVTCGKPTSKEKTCKGQQITASVDKNGNSKNTKKCANKVDIWYYNCGDNDYIYALMFENGILINESTEGQGKGKSDCLGK